MKNIIILLTTIVLLFCAVLVFADDAVINAEIENDFFSGLTLKQGFVVTYDDTKVKNLTTVEVFKTKKVEKWGKWNLLWNGWTVDVGFAYDGNAMNTGAILLGREFGTLDDYLPVEFPLDNLIKVTLYPVGIYADDLFSEIHPKMCSGGAFLKMTVNF
jgi:hypothetical protein